jgi:hypothetical protein
MLLYTLGLSYAHEASNQVKYEKQDADELFASLVYICCRKLAHPCRRDNTRVGAGCRQPPDSNSTFNSVHVPMLRSSPQCMGPLDRLEIVQRALFARPCASQGAGHDVDRTQIDTWEETYAQHRRRDYSTSTQVDVSFAPVPAPLKLVRPQALAHPTRRSAFFQREIPQTLAGGASSG